MNQAESSLFNLDGCADFLELLLDGLCLILRDGFLDGSGSAVNQSLGFLQTETGDLADNLDDLDLLCAGGSENDVKLSLGGNRSGTAICGSGNSNSGSGGNAEFFLDSLDKLGKLKNGHGLYFFDNVCNFLRHGVLPP